MSFSIKDIKLSGPSKLAAEQELFDFDPEAYGEDKEIYSKAALRAFTSKTMGVPLSKEMFETYFEKHYEGRSYSDVYEDLYNVFSITRGGGSGKTLEQRVNYDILYGEEDLSRTEKSMLKRLKRLRRNVPDTIHQKRLGDERGKAKERYEEALGKAPESVQHRMEYEGKRIGFNQRKQEQLTRLARFHGEQGVEARPWNEKDQEAYTVLSMGDAEIEKRAKSGKATTTVDHLRVGWYNTERNVMLGAGSLLGSDPEKMSDVYDDLEKMEKWTSHTLPEGEGFFDTMLYGTLQSLPFMATAYTPYGIGMVLYGMGSFLQQRYRQTGMKPSDYSFGRGKALIAGSLAVGVGFAQIERMGRLFGLQGWGRGFASKTADKVLRKYGSKTILDTIAARGTEATIDTILEIAEEGLQEILMDSGLKLSQGESVNLLNQLKTGIRTSVESIPAVAGLMLFGGGVSTTITKPRARKKARNHMIKNGVTVDKATDIARRMVKANNPKLQKEIQKEALAATLEGSLRKNILGKIIGGEKTRFAPIGVLTEDQAKEQGEVYDEDDFEPGEARDDFFKAAKGDKEALKRHNERASGQRMTEEDKKELDSLGRGLSPESLAVYDENADSSMYEEMSERELAISVLASLSLDSFLPDALKKEINKRFDKDSIDGFRRLVYDVQNETPEKVPTRGTKFTIISDHVDQLDKQALKKFDKAIDGLVYYLVNEKGQSLGNAKERGEKLRKELRESVQRGDEELMLAKLKELGIRTDKFFARRMRGVIGAVKFAKKVDEREKAQQKPVKAPESGVKAPKGRKQGSRPTQAPAPAETVVEDETQQEANDREADDLISSAKRSARVARVSTEDIDGVVHQPFLGDGGNEADLQEIDEMIDEAVNAETDDEAKRKLRDLYEAYPTLEHRVAAEVMGARRLRRGEENAKTKQQTQAPASEAGKPSQQATEQGDRLAEEEVEAKKELDKINKEIEEAGRSLSKRVESGEISREEARQIRNELQERHEAASKRWEEARKAGAKRRAERILNDPESTKAERSEAYSDLMSFYKRQIKQAIRQQRKSEENGDEKGVIEREIEEAEARIKLAESEKELLKIKGATSDHERISELDALIEKKRKEISGFRKELADLEAGKPSQLEEKEAKEQPEYEQEDTVSTALSPTSQQDLPSIVAPERAEQIVVPPWMPVGDVTPAGEPETDDEGTIRQVYKDEAGKRFERVGYDKTGGIEHFRPLDSDISGVSIDLADTTGGSEFVDDKKRWLCTISVSKPTKGEHKVLEVAFKQVKQVLQQQGLVESDKPSGRLADNEFRVDRETDDAGFEFVHIDGRGEKPGLSGMKLLGDLDTVLVGDFGRGGVEVSKKTGPRRNPDISLILSPTMEMGGEDFNDLLNTLKGIKDDGAAANFLNTLPEVVIGMAHKGKFAIWDSQEMWNKHGKPRAKALIISAYGNKKFRILVDPSLDTTGTEKLQAVAHELGHLLYDYFVDDDAQFDFEMGFELGDDEVSKYVMNNYDEDSYHAEYFAEVASLILMNSDINVSKGLGSGGNKYVSPEGMKLVSDILDGITKQNFDVASKSDDVKVSDPLEEMFDYGHALAPPSDKKWAKSKPSGKRIKKDKPSKPALDVGKPVEGSEYEQADSANPLMRSVEELIVKLQTERNSEEEIRQTAESLAWNFYNRLSLDGVDNERLIRYLAARQKYGGVGDDPKELFKTLEQSERELVEQWDRIANEIRVRLEAISEKLGIDFKAIKHAFFPMYHDIMSQEEDDSDVSLLKEAFGVYAHRSGAAGFKGVIKDVDTQVKRYLWGASKLITLGERLARAEENLPLIDITKAMAKLDNDEELKEHDKDVLRKLEEYRKLSEQGEAKGITKSYFTETEFYRTANQLMDSEDISWRDKKLYDPFHAVLKMDGADMRERDEDGNMFGVNTRLWHSLVLRVVAEHNELMQVEELWQQEDVLKNFSNKKNPLRLKALDKKLHKIFLQTERRDLVRDIRNSEKMKRKYNLDNEELEVANKYYRRLLQLGRMRKKFGDVRSDLEIVRSEQYKEFSILEKKVNDHTATDEEIKKYHKWSSKHGGFIGRGVRGLARWVFEKDAMDRESFLTAYSSIAQKTFKSVMYAPAVEKINKIAQFYREIGKVKNAEWWETRANNHLIGNMFSLDNNVLDAVAAVLTSGKISIPKKNIKKIIKDLKKDQRRESGESDEDASVDEDSYDFVVLALSKLKPEQAKALLVDGMNHLHRARINAFLGLNPAWMLITQPASYVITMAKTGKYAFKAFADKDVDDTESFVLGVKSKAAQGLRGVATMGDFEDAASRPRVRQMIRNWGSVMPSLLEHQLTTLSYKAGYMKAKEELNLTDKEAQIYGDYIAATTQTMYDRVTRNSCLNYNIVRVFQYFQSFALTQFGNIAEIAGDTGLQSSKITKAKTVVTFIAGKTLLNFLWSLFMGDEPEKALLAPAINRNTLGSFIPFVGDMADDIGRIANPYRDNRIYGRNNLADMVRETIRVWKGIAEDKENADTELKIFMYRYVTPFMGIPGSKLWENWVDWSVAKDSYYRYEDIRGYTTDEVEGFLWANERDMMTGIAAGVFGRKAVADDNELGD